MVEKELQRLETLGIIKPVKSSKWAAPIVPVRLQVYQDLWRLQIDSQQSFEVGPVSTA